MDLGIVCDETARTIGCDGARRTATSVYREAGEPRVRAFGEWDAPITDDAEWIDAPTDLACMFCRRRFGAGDNGAILPTGFATHRDCILRAILGGSA
jgi:hypothetical protein